MQRPLSLDQFHEQWYLYRHEDLPPVNSRTIVLEPRVVESGRGRPTGASNIPASQQTGRQDTSTRREPSAFERLLSQEEPRRRGRGCGRVQPYSRPNGQQTPQEARREGDSRNNEPHGNSARGRGAQRADQRGQYEGDMTGIMEF
jgi:hypothetical protein